MASQKLKIFFDGRCYLCSHEIDIYRRRNEQGRLEFVDISHANFKPEEYGVDPVSVNKEFHVQTADGMLLKGVSAFVAIWQVLPGGWQILAKTANLWPVKKVMQGGYFVFAKIRPHLPRRSQTCSEGVCFR